LKKFIDIDVVILYLYSVESIYRFGFCYLHQNRLTGCSLCGSYNIFFVSAAIAVVAAIP
jgi:hypothetical protein